jgi:hypothetical protein
MTISSVLICLAQSCFGQTNFFPLLVCSNATYANATIESVTPATVTVWWSGGGERISITNLPVELQKRYHYSPEEAQKYLDAQAARKSAQDERNQKAAAALDEAKHTFGPAQTIRVVSVIDDWHVQIMANGQLADAYVHKLPPEVVAFVRDYVQTRADVDATQYVSTNTAAGRKANSAARAGRATPANSNAPVTSDEASAVMVTRRHLANLDRHVIARTSIVARPSAFVLRGGIRQWEFDEMAEVKEK